MTNNYVTDESACYRHPGRLTAVSCGKCGRPLCPDCINHGPVGIRCRECLLPSNGRSSEFTHAPADVDKARWITLVISIIFAGIIGKIASMIFDVIIKQTLKNFHQLINTEIGPIIVSLQAPNLFISMVAGFVIGYVIWRTVGKTWNRTTFWLAAIAGLLIPVVAAVLTPVLFSKETIDFLKQYPVTNTEIIHLIIRTTIASLLSGGLSILVATHPRGPGL